MTDGDFIIKLIAAISLLANFIGIVAKLRGTPEHRSIGPQPFEVQAKAEFVPRPDFHKHAELNRDAHEKLEIQIGHAVSRIESSVAALAREVGEIKTLRAENGRTLDHLIDQVSALAKTVHELNGVVHQFLRTGGRPK